MADHQQLFDRFKPRAASSRSVVVIGLGRFGSSLASTLMELGHEVLAIDRSPEKVARYADEFTVVAEGDTTDVDVLRQLGVADMEHAVVAIGTGVEANILTTAALVDLEIRDIWAKALTTQHKSILERVGAHHVVLPETEMGRRVAHLVTGKAVDYVTLDEDFVLVETSAPGSLIGRSLTDSHIRDRHDVTVVCVKPIGGHFTYATADTVVQEGDLLLVAGPTASAERFAELD